MFKFSLKGVIAACLLALSFSSNASLITVNGNAVEAVQIPGTFGQFYNTFKNANGANNALALESQIVLFIAQRTNGTYGIFSIFNNRNAANDRGGFAGAADVTANANLGRLVISDDGSEFPNFAWDLDYTDGFVWGVLTSDSWKVNLDFTNLRSLTGYTVYTADANNNLTVAFSGAIQNRQFSAAVQSVNEPATALILALSGLLLARRRFVK